MRKLAAALSALLFTIDVSHAADQGCKNSHALTGRCYVVRGKISMATEIGPYLELPGTKEFLVIRPAPDSSPTKILPENLLPFFRNEPRADEVSGIYQVCPIPGEAPLTGHRHICVESGSGLSGIRLPRPVRP
jgi:hypothetical protein